MDRISPKQRSRNMSRIPSRNTAPERAVRSAIHGLGYRFKLKPIRFPGTPDVVLTRHRIAVFVHGCFWHRHSRCKETTSPKSNVEFWAAKFKANKKRDKKVCAQLAAIGWRVVTVWECQTEDRPTLTTALRNEGLRANRRQSRRPARGHSRR